MPAIPLWLIFAVTVALVWAGFEIGHAAGRRRRKREPHYEQEELGSLVGAMLGLLGFMLAIAFGGQLSRFDSSKALLLDEAAAIYTLYLRTDMLPPEAGDFVRQRLREYVAVRLDTGGDIGERIRESLALQQSMWKASIDAGETMPETFPKELYFDSLNELITLHEKRLTVGLHERMPRAIWVALYALSILAFAVTGYHGAITSERRSAARPVAVFAFALIITMVADLDRPGTGRLQLNEAALLDVSARMQPEPAGSD